MYADRDQMRDRQWREERRGRGRGGRWGGDGTRWSNAQPEEGEGDEEENLERNSRLYSSLTDPQDVPRKGYFFEVMWKSWLPNLQFIG